MAGLIVVVIDYVQGGGVDFAWTFLVVLASVLGLLLWATRPRRAGPDISHVAAQAAAGDSDVILYWMPGCIYCDLLKLGLGDARHDVSWVNILADSEAAEFVATYRNGNETVPTAITGAGEMIEPTPAAIKAQLGAAS